MELVVGWDSAISSVLMPFQKLISKFLNAFLLYYSKIQARSPTPKRTRETAWLFAYQ